MAAAPDRGVCSGGHFAPQLHLEARRRRKQSESIVDLKTQSVKLRTMESVRSSFHAQLATVMDSLLAAAVCEIAKIFESSLCEQQTELMQKTEEIHLLRDTLEKERRQRRKSGSSEDGEAQPTDRDGSLTLAGTGVNVRNDDSSQQDPVGGPRQNLSGLKEEVTGNDGASVKHERAASRPTLGSVAVQAEKEGLAGDQRQTVSVTQAKAKLSHWDEGSHSVDDRPLQDQDSTPFLSISQSGCCSPRPDPGLTQPGGWLPQLDATRGLENLQADGTRCSVPVSCSAGTETPCFRPGFGSDEASNDSDDGPFPFLDQEPENQTSTQDSAHGQGMGQTEAREDQPQAPTGESPWISRDERGGRININLTRRVTTLGIRDPLRPQSNSQSLTLRHANSLSHPPAPGGGNVRPYTCPYCTKCFTYPSHQRRHLLRHTGVRLHPCQFCDKSFLTPSELTVHTRTHTGERPFGCAQCGKRFARSGNLRAHQRDVHMGKRPFACTECGKRFAHRGNLRVHNHRVHQGDPYYMEDQREPDLVPNPM